MEKLLGPMECRFIGQQSRGVFQGFISLYGLNSLIDSLLLNTGAVMYVTRFSSIPYCRISEIAKGTLKIVSFIIYQS